MRGNALLALLKVQRCHTDVDVLREVTVVHAPVREAQELQHMQEWLLMQQDELLFKREGMLHPDLCITCEYGTTVMREECTAWMPGCFALCRVSMSACTCEQRPSAL